MTKGHFQTLDPVNEASAHGSLGWTVFGYLVVALTPALFWTGLIYVVARWFGINWTGWAMASVALAIGVFSGLLFAAIRSHARRAEESVATPDANPDALAPYAPTQALGEFRTAFKP